MIAAENFADFFDDVGIEAADRCPDSDHGRDADDDADQRQKCPQFVSKDRL